jgi:anti-sigma-K factor RskA
MNIDRRFLLLLAIAAGTAVGAVAASKARVRHHRTARDRHDKTEIKSWENEGGNLAPAAVSPAQP